MPFSLYAVSLKKDIKWKGKLGQAQKSALNLQFSKRRWKKINNVRGD